MSFEFDDKIWRTLTILLWNMVTFKAFSKCSYPITLAAQARKKHAK